MCRQISERDVSYGRTVHRTTIVGEVNQEDRAKDGPMQKEWYDGERGCS